MYEIQTHGSVIAGKAVVKMAGTALRTFVYYVDGACIDTGPVGRRSAYEQFIASLDAPPTQVALTHLHEDHCGNAAYFTRRGVPVYCHRDFTETMARAPRLPLYRRAFWGVPEPFVAQPFAEVFVTEHYSFDVIDTPGHAAEHVVLHEKTEGWLFAGDLFVAPRMVTAMRHESLPLLMQSIRKTLTLDFETLFCAHAGVVEDGKGALQRRLRALEDIEGRVHELAHEGWSPRRVRRHLFPTFQPLTWLSFGEYSPGHVVRSLWPPAD